MLSENTLFSIFFRIENRKQFSDYQICFLIFFYNTKNYYWKQLSIYILRFCLIGVSKNDFEKQFLIRVFEISSFIFCKIKVCS